MKYFLFVLLLVAVIITAGCIGGNQNAGGTPTQTTSQASTTILTTTPQTTTSLTPVFTPTPTSTLTNVGGMHPMVYSTPLPINNLTLLSTKGDTCFSITNVTQLRECPKGLWYDNLTPTLCKTYSTGLCYLIWVHKSNFDWIPGSVINLTFYDSDGNIVQTNQNLYGGWIIAAQDENGNWAMRAVITDKWYVICHEDVQSAVSYSVEVSKSGGYVSG